MGIDRGVRSTSVLRSSSNRSLGPQYPGQDGAAAGGGTRRSRYRPPSTSPDPAELDASGKPISTARKCKNCCRSFLAFLFSKVGICVLVVGYSIGGAFMFKAIEAPAEVEMTSKVELMRNATVKKLWLITHELNVLSEEQWRRNVTSVVRKYQRQLVDAVKDGYDAKGGEQDGGGGQWSFSGSFLYSLTVITTIGYGNIAPRTEIGKIVTILYSIFGIPLMLLYLTNIGDILAKSFRYVYGNLCQCGGGGLAGKRSRSRSARRNKSRSSHSHSTQSPMVAKAGLIASGIVSQQPVSSKLQRQNTFSVRNPAQPQRSPGRKVQSSSPCPGAASGSGMSPFNRSVSSPHFDKSLLVRPGTLPPEIGHTGPTRSVSRGNSGRLHPAAAGGREQSLKRRSASRHRSRPADSSPGILGGQGGGKFIHVPITLSLTILIAYVMGGGILFSQWEGWPYLDGAYFCFISLSTIGFGDLVPGDSISGNDTESQEKLVICSLYILFGLALIAMCFNLMQEEVIHKVTMCCMRVGIIRDREAEAAEAEEEEAELAEQLALAQQEGGGQEEFIELEPSTYQALQDRHPNHFVHT